MRVISCFFLLAMSLGAQAADAPLLPSGGTDKVLLPSGGTDQVPLRVTALPAPTLPSERAPVRFSWALDPDDALSAPAPHVVESREYWQTVEADELQRGLDISTSAPGALIRVSPVVGAATIEPDAVRVTRAGQPVALTNRTNAAQLQAAGMPVAQGSAAVQLERTAAAGRYSVQVPQARGRYVVHVYEPLSDVRLLAVLGRDRVLAGGGSNVVVEMLRGTQRVRGMRASGLLVAPSGRSWPLALRIGSDGRLHGKVPVPADAGSEPGLWEVQVFAGDGTLQRDARTALAVAQPTAKLGGGYRFDAARLQFALPVEAGSSGRFEVRGTLYATAPDRSLRPVSIAHSADWLQAGDGRLLLAFDRAHLPAGYGAPFELRDLELNDQSRMAPIERRSRAARVTR